ncbi:barwin-like endoglucanase [Tricholoma matsutake]|nr:barwin-like endoglucanase [Tricholoma matsutake 945]
MLSFILSLLFLSSVSPTIIPRRHILLPRQSSPPGYANGYLEEYEAYHARYLAIGCQHEHNNSTFFNQCCHPLLATEKLATARPPQCIPSSSTSLDDQNCSDTLDSSSTISSSSFSHTQSSTYSTTTTYSSSAPSQSVKSVLVPSKPPPSNPPPSNPPNTNTGLNTGGFATFFYQNGIAGACGTVHTDYAFIAALDSARYNGGSFCGKHVLITNTANGKKVNVTVADDCPTCINSNSIDLSEGAFTQIGDLFQGQLPSTY